MKLTQEVVSRFVGGQLEAQNQNEGYLYRGEISKASMLGTGDDQKISVEFAWFAMMNNGEWEVTSTSLYEASMMIYDASDIGGGRIFLTSWITGESTTLFPPDGSKLDPAKVRGLANA